MPRRPITKADIEANITENKRGCWEWTLPITHNAGYPTIDHRTALRARGLTPFHRHDFGTVKLLRAVENQLELALASST